VSNLKKRIILETKRKFFSNRTGNHTSIFRGSGIEFRDLKEYDTSDSARHINWKKSTKEQIVSNSFSDDRELNIVVVLLNSGSLNFANKKQKAIEALTTLTTVAIEQKESLSTLFFNSKDSKFFTPTKKRVAIDLNYQIAKEVKYQADIDYKKLTDTILHLVKKRSIIFLIGDFLEAADLKILSQIHEIYAVIIRAKEEENLQLNGELNVVDLNSKAEEILNISKGCQKLYNKMFQEEEKFLIDGFNRCKVVYTKIYNSDNTVDRLRELTKWTR